MLSQTCSQIYIRTVETSSSFLLGTSASSSLAFLGKEDCLDIGQDSTLGDGDSSQELVQLLVVPDPKNEILEP